MHKYVRSMICLTMALFMLFSSGATAETLESVRVNAAPLITQSASVDGMVRVYLSSLGSPSTLTLTVSGSYSLSDGTTLSSGERLTISFTSATGALTLKRNGTTYSMGTSFTLRRHSTTGSNGIKISEARKPGNLYPGDIEFKAVAQSGGGYRLYTIAHIYIENYLYGVVPYEMGSSAPIEALKAQAVAARTYTVRMMSARSARLYDVVDTTGDQTYNGTPSSVTSCNTAVDATKGVVLQNGSAYTATYYSSSNGGQTEAIANAWGTSGYSYLNVHDDPFDYANPDSPVKKATVYADANASGNNETLIALLKSKAVAVLANAGYHATQANTTIQTITGITPHTPKYADPSRLYTKMDFTMTVKTYNASDAYVSVSTTVTCDIFDELEGILGISLQTGKNELWSVVENASSFTIEARRHGHAIGMSQRGAMYMAKLGYTYDEILGFYYQGSTRVGCTFTNTILAADSSEEIVTDEVPVEIDDDTTVKGTVSLPGGGQLSIRAAKSSTADVLALLDNGTLVTVLTDDGTWCKIAYGRIIGYVKTSALSIAGTAPSSDDSDVTAIDGFAVVKSSNYLNLRESGSYTASILSTAPHGAILTVLSRGDDWAHIQYNRLEAYAATEFLTFYDEYPGDIQEGGSGGDETSGEDAGDGETLTATVATKSGSLNMRALPKAGSTVITTIPQYAAVTVTDLGSTWSGVTYNGHEGYVMTTFLSFAGDAADTPEPEDTTDLQATVATKSGSLNLRAKAKAGSAIYCTVPQYAVVRVLEKGSEWCKVTYSGTTGYVMTAFLSFIDDKGDDTGDAAGGETNTDPNRATVDVGSGSLNLRASKSSDAAVLVAIPDQSIIALLIRGDDWCKVAYGSYQGYVQSQFLTFVPSADPTATPEPTATPAPTQTPEPTATPAPTAIPTETPAPEAVTAWVNTANGGSLNLRNAPNGKVLTTIPQYAQVSVHSDIKATWCATEYGGYTGYTMSKYLTTTRPGQATEPTAAPQATATPAPNDGNADITAWVSTSNGGSLNLRNTPNGRVLTAIPQYAEVKVLSDITATWCKTQYGSMTGYTVSKFLTTVQPSATATPSPTATPDTKSTDEAESITAWVNTPDNGSLNLRSVPNGSVLLTIPQFSKVLVFSDLLATWCRTQYNGVTGYTVSKYLTTAEPDKKQSAAPNTPSTTDTPETSADDYSVTAWVNTPEGSLNLRNGPNGKVLTTIPQYAQVTVLSDISSTWCKTEYGSATGYTLSKYLTTKKPSVTSASTASPSATVAPTAAPSAVKLDPTLYEPDHKIVVFVRPPAGAATLGLYEECSQSSKKLATMDEGEQVEVVMVGETWCEVLYGNKQGYCERDGLSFIDE